MGAYVESPDDIDHLMAVTDPDSVSLLFDSGHAYFGGATDPNALLQKHVARVVHAHFKDVRRRWSRGHVTKAGVFCMAFSMAPSPCRAMASWDYGAMLSTLKKMRGTKAGWWLRQSRIRRRPDLPLCQKGLRHIARCR